jgi:Peptidase family M28
MMLKSLTLIAVLALLSACGTAEEADDAASSTVAATAEPAAPLKPVPEVDVERIRADAEALASDEMVGRDTGTAEYLRAAEFVAAAMSEAGLAPAGIDGYMQPVPYLRRQLDTESAEVTLHLADGDHSLSYPTDFLMGGDIVRDRTRVSAPLIFAGFGIRSEAFGIDDFSDIDVEGAIVVTLSGAPASLPSEERAYYSSGRTKAALLAELGAAGQIVLQTNVDRARVPWERSMSYAGRPGLSWLSDSGEASGFFASLSGGAALSPDASDALIAASGRDPSAFFAAVDEGDYEAFEFGFSSTLSRRTTHELIESPNVVGLLPGSDPTLADQFVVISAHLDHLGRCQADDAGDDICNGFYDNAIGISIMLETARALRVTMPRRPILFVAVGGEEKGLLGSDYFAHYPTVPIDQIVANVNLDMPVVMAPTAQVIAFGADHTSLGPIAEQAVARLDMTLVPDPMPEQAIFVRSDHYMFVRQGVPSIYLSPAFTDAFGSFLQNHYHRPSDQMDLPVDWPSIASFARANASVALSVADGNSPPSWNEDDFFGELFAR